MINSTCNEGYMGSMKYTGRASVSLDGQVLGEVRFALVPDGELWFIQGFEVDCASQGSTAEEALSSFRSVLSKVVSAHLKKTGNLRHLPPAPPEVWQEFGVGSFDTRIFESPAEEEEEYVSDLLRSTQQVIVEHQASA